MATLSHLVVVEFIERSVRHKDEVKDNFPMCNLSNDSLTILVISTLSQTIISVIFTATDYNSVSESMQGLTTISRTILVITTLLFNGAVTLHFRVVSEWLQYGFRAVFFMDLRGLPAWCVLGEV